MKIKIILLKTFLITGMFIFVYQFYNFEIIRSSIEDRAFDIVNQLYCATSETSVDMSPVVLLQIDKYSLLEDQLLDEKNSTNYGYLYPRDRLAKIITKLDSVPVENQPSVLFLDFDLSYSSLPYGKELSSEDSDLLSVLKIKRSYPILIPKTSEYNIVEKSNDKEIIKQLENKNIILVSVGFTISRDGYSRRYVPSHIFEDKRYWSAPIYLWSMETNQSISNISKLFQESDIINNRIIYKDYKEEFIDTKKNGYITRSSESYWNTLMSFSSNYPLEKIDLKDAIVLLGTSHADSEDFFTINGADRTTISGIEMHGNALMTLAINKGPLKRLSLFNSMLVIFIIFFIVDFLLELISNKYYKVSDEIEFMVSLLVSSVLLFSVSILLLGVFNLWFNWLIPFILFQVYEIIEFIIYRFRKFKSSQKKVEK